jgi:hypothetical protein
MSKGSGVCLRPDQIERKMLKENGIIYDYVKKMYSFIICYLMRYSKFSLLTCFVLTNCNFIPHPGNVLLPNYTLSIKWLTHLNLFFVPELMDYPDLDEDRGTQAVVNPNILDAEDAEMAGERTARTGYPGAEPTTVSGDRAKGGDQGRGRT